MCFFFGVMLDRIHVLLGRKTFTSVMIRPSELSALVLEQEEDRAHCLFGEGNTEWALSRPPPSSPGHETYSLRVSYPHLGRVKLLTQPRRNAPHTLHTCPHIPHVHTQHI